MLRKFLILLLMVPLSLFAEDEAFVKYQEGERAKSAEDRKKAFNDALVLYLQLQTESPSAKLCFNIANCYYQLSELGLAILYYNKALKENPRFDAAYTNLQIALQKAGIQGSQPSVLQTYLLFFYYKLSHNEKAIGALFALFAAFALFSVHLWVPNGVVKQLGGVCTGIAIILSISLVWADYFSAPQAVVIRPVALRRDAGNEYALILGSPLLSGVTVTVLSVKDNGDWLKVQTNSGEVGYVSKEYARII